MNAQCPKCQKTQEVPDIYRGQQVKCLHCQHPFVAAEYIEPSNPLPRLRRQARYKKINALMDAIFKAAGGLVLALLLGIIWLSVIVCGLTAANPQLGAIQYLLAVCAACLLILAAKK